MRSNAELETRIAEAYGAVRPAPGVGEELLGNLPEQSPPGRRRGWRRLAWTASAAGIVAAVLFWPRPRDESPPAAFEGAQGEFALPVVARPREGAATVGTLDAPRQVVQLTRDGTVQVPEWEPFRSGMRAVTLEELAEQLQLVQRRFAVEQEARGAGADERGASRLNVALRVDGDAPWRHVQWLLTVCAEQHFARIWFAAREEPGGDEYLLDARLPVDPGVAPADRPEVVKVQVRILPRKHISTPHGNVVIQVAYRVGANETEDPGVVGRWAGDAIRSVEGRDLQVVGEIKAEARIPFRYVAGILAVLRDRGIERVDFYGTALPTDEERRAATLPYPKGGWPGVPGEQHEER